MFRIAICDDEKNVCSVIESFILDYARETGLSLDIEVFYSGEALFRYVKEESSFDLIFLDIEMEQMNGIELSEKIRKDLNDIDTEIVYVSCTTKYDRKLFDYHPLAFIAKPLQNTQLRRALSLALKRKNIRKPLFTFTYNRLTQSIPFDKILYFESDDRKVNIVTASESFSYYEKLSDIKDTLPAFFCQIHRSYIINTHHILQYGSREVTLQNGQKIAISKLYREAFLKCQLAELQEDL